MPDNQYESPSESIEKSLIITTFTLAIAENNTNWKQISITNEEIK